jgi:hypothetical protein
MLKFMTKETFKKAIDERRFMVQNVKGNQYEVFYIGTSDNGQGVPQMNVSRVVNPDSKDGYFKQNGGGYNKAHACIEEIAWYVDHNAEDKDDKELSCISYWALKQNVNSL